MIEWIMGKYYYKDRLRSGGGAGNDVEASPEANAEVKDTEGADAGIGIEGHAFIRTNQSATDPDDDDDEITVFGDGDDSDNSLPSLGDRDSGYESSDSEGSFPPLTTRFIADSSDEESTASEDSDGPPRLARRRQPKKQTGDHGDTTTSAEPTPNKTMPTEVRYTAGDGAGLGVGYVGFSYIGGGRRRAHFTKGYGAAVRYLVYREQARAAGGAYYYAYNPEDGEVRRFEKSADQLSAEHLGHGDLYSFAQPEVNLDEFSFEATTVQEPQVSDTVIHQLAARRGKRLPKGWVIIDSGSTDHIFVDRDLLRNIRPGPRTVSISTGGGMMSTNLIGDVPGLKRPAWFMKDGIANIIALDKLKLERHVTYDSRVADEFRVHCGDRTRRFVRKENGLYVWVTNAKAVDPPGSPTRGVALVATVADKLANYTVKEQNRIHVCREHYESTGFPSIADFIKDINCGRFVGNPLTAQDAKNMVDVYGPNESSLQGKTVWRKPHRVAGNVVNIPPTMMEKIIDVVLTSDIMFVNGVGFLVTLSRKIYFGTTKMMPLNRRISKADILAGLAQVRDIYARRGFRITLVLGDGQYESCRDGIAQLNIGLNTTSADEHVGDIERFIRTLKERVRCFWNRGPFEFVPPKVTNGLVGSAVFWLNVRGHYRGVSVSGADNLSPREIVLGVKMQFKHCSLRCLEFVHTHEEHDNTMKTRTLPALALQPLGNEQGGWMFFNLKSGQLIKRYQWTKVNMPD